MSAYPADIPWRNLNVRFGPKGDMLAPSFYVDLLLDNDREAL
jgi:hypothetical protein